MNTESVFLFKSQEQIEQIITILKEAGYECAYYNMINGIIFGENERLTSFSFDFQVKTGFTVHQKEQTHHTLSSLIDLQNELDLVTSTLLQLTRTLNQ